MRARRAEAGFTLVEVLVGALVLGIFVSFVYGVVVSGFRVRKAVQSSTSALADGTLAVDLVARDLECAFWRPVVEFDAFKAEEEGEGRSSVRFLTTTDSRREETIDDRTLRSDVTEVGYRTKSGESGMILYRREQFGVDDDPLDGGDYFKVVAGVKEFRLDWFEKDPTAEGSTTEDEEGLPTWDAKERKDGRRIPRAARITLVMEGKSSDATHADETVEYRFVRWAVLPGADDVEPKAAPQQ